MGVFDFLKKGRNMDEEIQEYLAKGAVVIDVRTVPEFEQGHVEGSHNIVLDGVPYKIDEIKALGNSIIAVCRSGARSGSAANFLSQHGIDIINGGPWQAVAKFVK